ncbi:coiled-coil domain-containing protein [Histomonas meleagridis]|uniref:coiled-coil domain-containing protein 22-like n=1 Tax=Histomonas meleagridis TaxID=135588 RepID=UPI003559DCD7|nr:coiled-coil domain-containing protein [Histomonas meleagridis]KAH0801152.1 coiled-coil domain-containing protein 22-like [Histomonas meleagridis]
MNSDDILQRQLQMIGYKKASSIQSFGDITSDQFIDIILYIFNQIPQTANQLSAPPKSHSALFKYTTQMVSLMSSLGYYGDLRYDNFMYPKADKTYDVLRFLLEKVPRSESVATKTTTSVTPLSLSISSAISTFSEAQKQKNNREPIAQPLPLLNSSLPEQTKSSIKSILKQPKIPFIAVPILSNSIPFNKQCGPNSFASLLSRNDRESDIDTFVLPEADEEIATKQTSTKSLQKVAKRAFATSLSSTEDVSISAQPTSTAPSAKIKSRLENIARFEFGISDTKIGASVVVPTVAASSLVSREAEIQQTEEVQQIKDVSKEPKLTMEQVRSIKAEQHEELQSTVELLQATEQKVAEIEDQLEAEREELNTITVDLQSLINENEKLEAEAERVKNVATVSTSDSTQIKQLKRDLIDSTSEILDIANQWEPKRKQLIAEYRELTSFLKRRKEDRQLQMAKLAKLKRQLQEGEEKMQSFDVSINELKNALEARGEQMPRHHYVEMIFDMIKKISKQEAEVEKMRVDYIAENQRMNQTVETVKRTWMLLDETIYSEAKKKKEEWMNKSYRMVVELLTILENTSENVELSGKLSAQAMELESKIDKIKQQNDPKALKRILKDLEEVKEEIKELESR